MFELKLAQARREMPSGISSKPTDHPNSGVDARRNRRPKRRTLFFPAHPDQRIEGNGRKYFLPLLSPEELQQRGMSGKQARLVIHAYPVLMLSNEWLEELFYPNAAQAGGATSSSTIGSTTACAGHLGICGSKWPMWIPQRPTPR